MTAAIEIYTRPGCGYCSAAKSLLTRKKAAFTEHGLDNNGGDPCRIEIRLEELLERGERVLHADAVVGNRERQMINLRQHRPESGLVRLYFSGEADTGERAAVKSP